MFSLISRHRVVAVYLFSLLWLATTVFVFTLAEGRAFANFWKIIGLVVGVGLVYALAWSAIGGFFGRKISFNFKEPALLRRERHGVLVILVVLYGLVVFIHFYSLGTIPVIEAAFGSSDLAVSIIRQDAYFDLPWWMRYASDYSLKALGPGLLLLTYYFRSRLFWVVLALGFIYSVGLFARILPLVLFLPLLVYQLLSRRWIQCVGMCAVMLVMVFSVSKISSVSTERGSFASDGKIFTAANEESNKDSFLVQRSGWESVSYGLYLRVMVVPAQVMEQWFDYYSDASSLENGCAYRILARMIGCEYVHVPSKLYAVYYPDNVRQGMSGSLNSASFMSEYANFGLYGFFLSSLFGGLFFVGALLVYQGHPLSLPMNMPLIVTLMESNFSHSINSGAGWLLMTSLYLYFVLFDPDVRRH